MSVVKSGELQSALKVLGQKRSVVQAQLLVNWQNENVDRGISIYEKLIIKLGGFLCCCELNESIHLPCKVTGWKRHLSSLSFSENGAWSGHKQETSPRLIRWWFGSYVQGW